MTPEELGSQLQRLNPMEQRIGQLEAHVLVGLPARLGDLEATVKAVQAPMKSREGLVAVAAYLAGLVTVFLAQLAWSLRAWWGG